MEKINKLLNIKNILLLSVLVFSLLVFVNPGILFGQAAPQKEICNGVDDNGDGRVDEGVNCDHYLSYLIDKSINPVNVVLRDQFIQPTDFQAVSIERLFNPAVKTHGGIKFKASRPDLHYLAYRVKTPATFTPRSVIIENQFERNVISVTNPRYLLTPTGKRKIGITDQTLSLMPVSAAKKLLEAVAPSVPKNANHYLCYDIEPYDVSLAASVKDQFQNRGFEVVRARYFCNPVEKMHNGKVSEIIDRNNHLTCYEVIPHNKVNRKVVTRDQFGAKLQTAIRTEEICVPTIKTHIDEPVCVQPDDQGTAVIFASDKKFQTTDGHLVVIQPSMGSNGLTADGILMSGPDTVINRGGSPSEGETYTFETEILQMSLSSGRVLNVPMNGQITTEPRTPGEAIQSFDTEMLQLQGQLPPGDPDFDLLRITAGSGFGLPSPGHTTLTRSGTKYWHVDSFFDITYRIDFVGAPGGAYAGMSGSTTATIRMQGSCSMPNS